MALTTVKVKWTDEAGEHISYSAQFTALLESVPKPIVCPSDKPEVLRGKALAYVNTARTALGAEPLEELPRGRQSAAGDCVIARAIPDVYGVGSEIRFNTPETAATVGSVWATDVRNGNNVQCPAALIEFIAYFDNGAYRDLIA